MKSDENDEFKYAQQFGLPNITVVFQSDGTYKCTTDLKKMIQRGATKNVKPNILVTIVDDRLIPMIIDRKDGKKTFNTSSLQIFLKKKYFIVIAWTLNNLFTAMYKIEECKSDILILYGSSVNGQGYTG